MKISTIKEKNLLLWENFFLLTPIGKGGNNKAGRVIFPESGSLYLSRIKRVGLRFIADIQNDFDFWCYAINGKNVVEG